MPSSQATGIFAGWWTDLRQRAYRSHGRDGKLIRNVRNGTGAKQAIPQPVAAHPGTHEKTIIRRGMLNLQLEICDLKPFFLNSRSCAILRTRGRMKKASIREVCLTCNLKPLTWNPFFGTVVGPIFWLPQPDSDVKSPMRLSLEFRDHWEIVAIAHMASACN
jgi:hypothetical protein